MQALANILPAVLHILHYLLKQNFTHNTQRIHRIMQLLVRIPFSKAQLSTTCNRVSATPYFTFTSTIGAGAVGGSKTTSPFLWNRPIPQSHGYTSLFIDVWCADAAHSNKLIALWQIEPRTVLSPREDSTSRVTWIPFLSTSNSYVVRYCGLVFHSTSITLKALQKAIAEASLVLIGALPTSAKQQAPHLSIYTDGCSPPEKAASWTLKMKSSAKLRLLHSWAQVVPAPLCHVQRYQATYKDHFRLNKFAANKGSALLHD